jgi:EAL domain-containing protein (putative c-di-GMP-specific phosphodiesterase class I)
MLPPGHFIGLAEETGLIVPLGRWVLRAACEQARHFPTGITTNVNLSPRQLHDPRLVDDVSEALVASGLDPSFLVLEITETVLMNDVDESRRTVHRLADLGVRVAIDDFGTGYSSLAYLQHFPVNALKIDKSFVDGLAGRPEDGTLARAVVRLGHSMGYQVTAEGIETRAQFEALRDLHCDLGQGYFFARPLPSEEAISFLAVTPRR